VLASLGRMSVQVTLFTDPACPFAFSAEPVRQRLRWHYGDQLEWSTRMIVLTDEPGEAEKLAAGAPNLQRRYGMPIDPAPYPRASSSEPACLAVVTARLDDPAAADRLLRRLRVRRMAGGLLDDPALIDAAARDAGLDPAPLRARSQSDEARQALAADRHAARTPTEAARALAHRLGGADHVLRYVAPSYELTSTHGSWSIPGFNPYEVYENALGNLDPSLERRERPRDVAEVLTWATEPLATAEIVALLGDDEARVRSELAVSARPTAAGADFYWIAA
jgi:predicted DsbA family dithiol-disulfide isomerase